MATTTFNQAITREYNESKVSILQAFFTWCRMQEKNRFMWLGIILAVHGCLLTPLTIMAVVFAGNNLTLFMLGVGAMAIALVSNLAALPTKVTIPTFIVSVLIDLGILIACFMSGFNPAATF